MIARGMALCMSLAFTATALGDANVVLVCDPVDCNFGANGGSGTVHVMIEQTGGVLPVLLRYAQFDLTDTDANLNVSLPITHVAPTGEISPSGDIRFWDFSTQEQSCMIPETCGLGHFIDDELPGALPPAPDIVSFA